MRSWAAGQLSRTICRTFPRCGSSGGCRSCGSSGAKSDDPQRSGSHKDDEANAAKATTTENLGLGLLPDEPILADFLAMGAAAAHAPRSAAPAEAQQGATEVRLPVETGQAHAPALDDGVPAKLQANTDEVPSVQLGRERRLIAAALRPALALPQAPSAEKPSWRPIDAGGLRREPRSLPRVFEQIATVPTAAPEHETELKAELHTEPRGSQDSRADAARHSADREFETQGAWPGGTAASYKARPLARGDGAPERQAVASAPATNSSLRAMRASVRVPRFLRQKLCRSLFASFSQVQAGDSGAAPASVQVLTPWETEHALRHCSKGAVMALVRHLAETELHIRNGAMRKGLARPADGHSERLQIERRELTRGWWTSVAHGLAEDVLISMFLDRRLSWSRVRPLLADSKASNTEAKE